ncbi:MAG: tetratricopeptide repeat protein [Spirochaetes bacterium]|nr:tetratricopeptide repeat protein [Spirochaetota bacterium]
MPEPETTDRLRNIVFIQVPPAFAREIGGFPIDPAIPIPVETGGGADRWKPGDLTREAIIAGMLRFLADKPGHGDAEYYRRFVLAVRPAILDELTETGVLKARNREFEVAEEVFLALAGLFPGLAGPLSNLASVYEERSDAFAAVGKDEVAEEYGNRAFETYKRLFTLDDVMSETYMNAGYFFLKKRNYLRAKELFENYIAHGTDARIRARAREIVQRLERQGFLDTLFKEAYDFIAMGREEEGIERARAFLESYPRVWNAWFLLGWAFRRLGRWEEGRDAFLKATEFGGGEPDTCNELAICLMELGEFEGSRRWLETALRKEPENIKIISNLGVLAKRRGRLDEAAGFFRAALEIESSDPIALRELANLGSS